MTSRWLLRAASPWLAAALAAAAPAGAEAVLRGELPRTSGTPLEQIPGLDSVYDAFTTCDGVRLSCDSIELPASQTSGWSNMLRRVAQESGMAMWRTEKRGVGDSEGGPCSALDYTTELEDHREALAALLP